MRSDVQMPGQVHVPVQASEHERQKTEGESHCKTDEIEIGPSHFDRLPSGRLGTLSGRSASSKRSARPGVSRIAPNNIRQARVSFWRAALSRTSLTSGSLAKRSEPCSSHTSSLPSVVRRSETSSV